MGKMDQMLSMFKKKEDPYADLAADISDQTKGSMGREEVEGILKTSEEGGVPEDAKAEKPESLN